ncbi:Oidioi.mRNA.OKI2018_I69.PAR.g12722.t2.cds [Oikopleura dioica]|uniref:Hexosyltransferase n=1 Tax=Oikopleura dioica TaxID=34765 RepID=A0ABN7S1B1_OIKDI|nr:Oidioi.mRNA.OKI2018_I69.PAR.g12722.t2.cds [Oikopleura dioica]
MDSCNHGRVYAEAPIDVVAAVDEVVDAVIDETLNFNRPIQFSDDLEHVYPIPFRKKERSLVPAKYLNSQQSKTGSNYLAYIVEQPEECDAKIVITVKSSADHFEHREAIRQSWAPREARKEDVQVVFLVGQGSDVINDEIKEEFFKHKDLVIGNYVDSYQNLTIKAMTGIDWRARNCHNAEFVLAVDDDTFVNLDDMMTHLQRLPEEENFIECSERTVTKGKVWREGQWAVSEDQYEFDVYPNYCNGPCYLMPVETADLLLGASRTTPSDHPADDVFISGILRVKTEVPLIQYTRTGAPGWCQELNNRKPRLPQRMVKEHLKKSQL